MATVRNKIKVLSIKGKVKAILQIENEKKRADMCWKFGLINSTNKTIWKRRTKIISAFEQNRLKKTFSKALKRRQ
jgi:3-methyladenine DNA glycosylase Tag